jgi:putative membrane protein
MGFGWMWLFWLLIIVGVALLVVVVVRAVGGGTTRDGPAAPGSGPSAARRVLDERYARGELSTEEYQERIRTLEQNR